MKRRFTVLIFFLLCAVIARGVDVVGGSKVTLPTFTSKDGASITATAVNGWSMESAEVDNTVSWTTASVSGNSAGTSYILDSTGKFAVTLSGNLNPPSGSGNGPTDFSVKANLNGELYIDAAEKIIAEGAPAVTLFARVNDQPFNANWKIVKATPSRAWSGAEISSQPNITVGRDGNWDPASDVYTITAEDPSGNMEPASITFKVVKIKEIKVNAEYAVNMSDPSMPEVELQAIFDPAVDLETVILKWELDAPQYIDGPSYTRKEKLTSEFIKSDKWNINFSKELFGGNFKKLSVRLWINQKGGASFTFDTDFFIIGDALSGAARNEYIDNLITDNNFKKILKVVILQETGGTHFWDGSGPKGKTSRKRYPWIDSKGGYGVMQLTDSNLLSKATVWNWKQNIASGHNTLRDRFNAAKTYLSSGGVYSDEMLRLETYTRYNGAGIRYYELRNGTWIKKTIYQYCPRTGAHQNHGSTNGYVLYSDGTVSRCVGRAEIYAEQCLAKESRVQ